MKDLAVIETILRNRDHFFVEIRDGVGLGEKTEIEYRRLMCKAEFHVVDSFRAVISSVREVTDLILIVCIGQWLAS